MKRLLAYLFCAIAIQMTASAHVLDEYVQSAQIMLARDGVKIELRLVPGVDVAERVFTKIDLNNDGQISSTEEQAYAQRVLKDLTLEVEGQRTLLALKKVEFPTRREMNEGVGAIRLELTAQAIFNTQGEHQIAFRNDHLPELSVYLVNALVPTNSEIKISGQERDPLQREMRLSFRATPAETISAPPASRSWAGVLIVCAYLVMIIPIWKQLGRS